MKITYDQFFEHKEAARKSGFDAGYISAVRDRAKGDTDPAYNEGWNDGYARRDQELAEQEEADIRANICDEMGCTKPASCGWGPPTDRRHTCYKHSQWFKESKL